MSNEVKVVYRTEFGPSETIIPLDELASFTRRFRIIAVRPIPTPIQEGTPYITDGPIEFKPIKTEKEMKQNEKNSHYIVTTKSGRREKVNADQVKQLGGMTRFYKGSDEVAMFAMDSVESIVKGRGIETR